MAIRVLLAEDDPGQRRVMEYLLAEEGYSVAPVASGEEALEQFREETPDLVLTDMSMPGMDGLELLAELKRLAPHVPVIIITAFGTIRTAVEAMRGGAFEYVAKPVNKDELKLVVAKALEHKALEEENARLRLEVKGKYRFANIVGASSPMKHLFDVMTRVAASEATALILGESGTGKELVARAIHYNSSRAGGPFVAVNCGAIPRELVEAELFGARKGAFTGATRDRKGRFELAAGGTIFLDEVSELPIDLQVKLLRVLDEREVTPVGAEKPVPVDARVLAATNRFLDAAVAEGDFREDLYYRLNVVSIVVPPLRKRADDIPLLVEHFLQRLRQPRLLGRPGGLGYPRAAPLAGQRAAARERDRTRPRPAEGARPADRRGPAGGGPQPAGPPRVQGRRLPPGGRRPRRGGEGPHPGGAREDRRQPDPGRPDCWASADTR